VARREPDRLVEPGRDLTETDLRGGEVRSVCAFWLERDAD